MSGLVRIENQGVGKPDWLAHIAGDFAFWGRGETPNEALGYAAINFEEFLLAAACQMPDMRVPLPE